MEPDPATPADTPEITPLAEGELIDDRALESREEDQFRLNDIVDELLGICRNAPTPATIALYASWGSGKSSLGQILDGEFESDPAIAYTTFNALKYAERTPLQRHFLSQVAAAFGVKDSKYSRDLYKSTTDTDYKVSVEKVKRLIWVLVGTVGAVFALVGAFALIAAAASSRRHYLHAVGLTLRGGVTGLVLSATLIAALVALLSQSLSIKTEISAPSSSEEFERLFKDLVAEVLKTKKRSKLVVFIDELDRCAPDQVVSVLETLRTFLEVDGCIFIVAADQQALEQAATEAARQSTPVNPGNPYYSSGSAYLDKIFQYQFPMPPLLPRRLSRFALDLIQDRPGVWTQIPNQPELVSVLIPTHVRSPRRVKALLNSFALLFRLALTRSTAPEDERTLDPGVAGRASEIGKLVCLRTEFPLFAADLQLDARLPELTLLLRDKPALTLDTCGLHGVAPEAFSRARAYAREELPVDEVIVRAGDPSGVSAATAEASPSDTPADPSASTSDPDEDEPTGSEKERVEVNQARQLIRYLERTRDIPGPGRDLVFLESSGAAFGLPGELAESLESDALDGQAEVVAVTTNTLTDDEEFYAALRLLARLVVEAIGIDAQNVLTSLLTAVGRTSRPLDPVVDDLLTAVASYRSGYQFKPEDLAGALRLALERDSDAARDVRETVLSRPEALSDPSLRELILQRSPALRGDDPERVAEVFTTHLTDAEPEDLSAVLAALPHEEVKALCADLDGDELDQNTGFDTLARAATAAHEQSDAQLGELLLRTLINLDPTAARTAAEAVIPEFAPISNADTIDTMLAAVKRLVLDIWPVWLDALDANAIAEATHRERLPSLVRPLWDKRFKPSNNVAAATDEAFEAAAEALERLAPNGLSVEPEDADSLLTSLPPVALTTQPEVPQREAQLATLWSLVERKLLEPSTVASLVLSDLEPVLAASVSPPMAPAVATYVVAEGSRALRDANSLGAFAKAVANSPWIDDSSRLILRAKVDVAEARLGAAASNPLAGEDLLALKEQATPEALDALAEWLRSYNPSPDVVMDLFDAETRSRTPINAALRQSIELVADHWAADEKAAAFTRLAPLFHAGAGGLALLESSHPSEAEPGVVVATLRELFDTSGNNDERRRVLRLWAIARPATGAAQRTLADEIYIPLLDKGQGAVKLAITNFDLVQHMTGNVQGRIKQALQEATRNDPDLAKRVDKRMRDAGWIKQKKPWWRTK